jgi:hypothetical protein
MKQVIRTRIHQEFSLYCEQYPDTTEAEMLEQVSNEFLAKLEALQIRQLDLEDSDEVANLQLNMGALMQNLTDSASNKM